MKLNTGDSISSQNSNWVFDEKVAAHFDEHVSKSVPGYYFIQKLAESFSDWFTYPNSTVIDFGASTGETLRRIKHRHSKPLNLIGYDNSLPMIEMAKKKGIELVHCDLEKPMSLPKHSYSIAICTLQFLRPERRHELLRAIYKNLQDKGAVFVVEKVLGSTPQMQDILQSLYWETKTLNGFTSEEIINKAKALRGCLYAKTIEENEIEFSQVGFNSEIVFKEFQFCGWILTSKI